MVKSKYMARFARLEPQEFPLRGNRIFVEILPKEELKVGSLFVKSDLNDHRTSTEMNRPTLCLVLAVGDGYVADDGTLEKLEIERGNIVLVSQHGLKLYSEYPGLADYTKETIAMTRDTECHVVWPSIEAFEAYKQKLSAN